MTSSLASRQGLLTKVAGKLASLLENFDKEATEEMALPQEETEWRSRARERKLHIQRQKKCLETAERNLNKMLDAYTAAADELSSDTPQLPALLEKVSTNSQTAQDLLFRAQEAILELDLRIENISAYQSVTDSTEETPRIQLAPLPIPKFGGKAWEWASFWSAFEHSVHSRNIDDAYKMNYLLDALRGEAKESLKQFEISGKTYALAVEHLKKKYGNKQLLVGELIERLEKCRAKTRRMEDQRRLCEEISSIITQMELQGEFVNSSIIQKLILSKFAEPLQRYALRKKQEIEDGETWHTKILLQELARQINSELEIGRHIQNDDSRPPMKGTSEPHSIHKRTKDAATYQPDLRRICFYCERRDHLPRNCPVFKTQEERLEVMRKKSLCRNCGGTNHVANQCSRGPCRLCEKHGHHTSVCNKATPSDAKVRPTTATRKTKTKNTSAQQTKQNLLSATTATSEEDEQHETYEANLCMRNATRQESAQNFVLLGAAQAVNPVTQTLENVHVLLDTGADRSFITEELANRLQLTDCCTTTLKISTFGSQAPIEKRCGITKLQLMDPSGRLHSFSVARIEKIMEPLHRETFTKDDLRFLAQHKIQLSIEAHTHRTQPEILLGCSDVFSLLHGQNEREWQLPSGIRLISSCIGYLVTGRHQDEVTAANVIVSAGDTAEKQDAQEQWEHFLELESAGLHDFSGTKAQEQERIDKAVWEEFESTVTLETNGYHVRLPWTEEANDLPDNKALAYKRLCSTIERLKTTPHVLKQYEQNFAEQIMQGILEEVPKVDKRQKNVVHYLAHQAVITPEKEYTKLRVVYDASAHLKDKPSLNDVLQRGPVMLPTMIHMLLRFRIGEIALIADVEKAFLQVHLHIQDRDAVRCLWLRDTSLPPTGSNVVEYRFTRVPFGLKCSPFLLGATIKHHLSSIQSYRDLAQEILHNVYVDNVILTASSEEEAVQKYNQSKAVFREMNMNLRGFQTNREAVNKTIPNVDQSTQKKPKVLGIKWDSTNDHIQIGVSFAQKPIYTKRTVCEQIASVFDPMGWLTPIMLHGKLFLQKLWHHDYDWDTPLSEEHDKEWRRITTSLLGCEVEVPRMTSTLRSRAKLVIFADASSNALAACAYLISERVSHLLFAKSRLANAKEQPTIPKMEMNAITLATRIAYMVYQALKSKIIITSITIFSDSQITLSWLAVYPIRKELGVLVRNRITEIRKTVQLIQVPVKFGYIETANNPADCATRGMRAEELKSHPWWRGPDFLTNLEETWTVSHKIFGLPEDSVGENIDTIQKKNNENHTCTLTSTNLGIEELVDWKRHNTLNTAQTAVAYALRFLQRISCRMKNDLRLRIEEKVPELREQFSSAHISVRERNNALNAIIRNHQSIYVNEHLRKSTKNLNLQEDVKKLLRCYGRLEKADIPEMMKKPLFIAAKTPLAQCVVRQAHSSCHLDTSHTMANIREKFWIPKLRQQVQSHVRKCVQCQRMNNHPYRYPAMGPLPTSRVVRAKPFENTGIDYFGPLTVKHGEDTGKMYGLIITCTITRLVHIEIVTDMSTEKLLMALRRFFARRGIPARIISDNGPSFILGEEILKRAVQSVTDGSYFQTKMAKRGIEWTTITPYAPWQGAVYERLIKSIKQSFYKTVGNRILTIEELTTLMTEVEGILNNRPLTYQGELFEDFKPLRPADFLVKEIELMYPFENLQENGKDPPYLPPAEKLQLQTRKQAEAALLSSHKLTEQYWTTWHSMYLSKLRESHKLHMDSKRASIQPPRVGTVVLLADPNLPRNTWKMGRITELKEGSDSAIREAVVRMPNGNCLRRPINLLVPLELDDDTNPSTKEHHSKTDIHNQAQKDLQKKDQVEGRYHLRKRREINYSEDKEEPPVKLINSIHISTLQTCLLILALILTPGMASTTEKRNAETLIKCITGGIEILSNDTQKYEVCSQGFCTIFEYPKTNETVTFPPEITLHSHSVQWKTLEGNHVKVIKMVCPPAPFCEQIRCWFCTANVFNPECHTTAAVIAVMTIAYTVTAVLYMFCYVPLVLGKPCRICGHATIGLLKITVYLLKTLFQAWRRRGHPQRRNIEELLRAPLITAILILITNTTTACQDVDVFTLKTKVCSRGGGPKGQKCYVDTTNVIKLNSFNQEACLRITKNGTSLKQYQLLWKGLNMDCEKETMAFTRNTVQNIVDAKRCAHSGSCLGDKCTNVNDTAKLPELALGNAYPGITSCVESCGGPGCGCFYLSSGCLFYRIYHKPDDGEIYEIFRCRSWKESVKLEVKVEDNERNQHTEIFHLQPTVPTTQGSLRLTLSSLSVPPTPALNAYFISNGDEIALWKEQKGLLVECDSREKAKNFDCSVSHNCLCQPAEFRVMCSCTDYNITAAFRNQLENRLPIRQPWGGFEISEKHKGSVRAKIPTLVTAELLVTIKEDIHLITKETTDLVCTVPNAVATGCYNCKQGAVAEVICTSTGERTRAAVRCEDYQLSIPCTEKGEISEIRFSFTVARVKLRCTVSCGTKTTHFEITGILKWVRTIHDSVRRVIKGETTVEEEIVFPDFGHILDTIVSSYKTIAFIILGFVIAIVIGYTILWTCGLRIIILILQIVFKGLLGIATVPLKLTKWIFRTNIHLREETPYYENRHIKQL